VKVGYYGVSPVEQYISFSYVNVLDKDIQGDTSGCVEPPVDLEKIRFGLSWPGQAKAKLLF